ncbi:MAG: response regulator transcription factor [Myxococcales bacterium]|nr:response regulator transcription factor [Myxococcales bacterium]
MPLSVLLVDDDQELASLLAEYLSSHDVTVTHVADGGVAVDRALAASYDVVLLDVMLPNKDGFTICKELRAQSETPIIMLTARGDDADRIAGLELGADDYLPKPFNPRELLARVRAVLRRAKRPPSSSEAVSKIVVGGLVIETGQMKVTLDGAEIALTSFEFRVLVELAKRAGTAVGREELATLVKGGPYDPQVDRSLDVHVSRLRQKLEADPRDPKHIRTIRGVGYMLARPG